VRLNQPHKKQIEKKKQCSVPNNPNEEGLNKKKSTKQSPQK
jgi:hypothetical protein